MTTCLGCDGKAKVRMGNRIFKCPVCNGSGYINKEKITDTTNDELFKLPGAKKFSYSNATVECKCGNSDIIETDHDFLTPPASNGRRRHRFEHRVLCPSCGESGKVVYYDETVYRRGNKVKDRNETKVHGCMVKK